MVASVILAQQGLLDSSVQKRGLYHHLSEMSARSRLEPPETPAEKPTKLSDCVPGEGELTIWAQLRSFLLCSPIAGGMAAFQAQRLRPAPAPSPIQFLCSALKS